MKFHVPLYAFPIESAFGGVLLAATDSGLAGLWFDAQRHAPDTTGWVESPAHPVLRQAATQLAEYFAGERTQFDLTLDLSHGTAFQQSVWQALLRIPHGATIS
jgi:methylated-DNA-[protein]-cysteine S-methyltransferase